MEKRDASQTLGPGPVVSEFPLMYNVDLTAIFTYHSNFLIPCLESIGNPAIWQGGLEELQRLWRTKYSPELVDLQHGNDQIADLSRADRALMVAQWALLESWERQNLRGSARKLPRLQIGRRNTIDLAQAGLGEERNKFNLTRGLNGRDLSQWVNDHLRTSRLARGEDMGDDDIQRARKIPRRSGRFWPDWAQQDISRETDRNWDSDMIKMSAKELEVDDIEAAVDLTGCCKSLKGLNHEVPTYHGAIVDQNCSVCVSFRGPDPPIATYDTYDKFEHSVGFSEDHFRSILLLLIVYEDEIDSFFPLQRRVGHPKNRAQNPKKRKRNIESIRDWCTMEIWEQKEGQFNEIKTQGDRSLLENQEAFTRQERPSVPSFRPRLRPLRTIIKDVRRWLEAGRAVSTFDVDQLIDLSCRTFHTDRGFFQTSHGEGESARSYYCKHYGNHPSDNNPDTHAFKSKRTSKMMYPNKETHMLEFKQHEGCLNGYHIRLWMELLAKFIRHAVSVQEPEIRDDPRSDDVLARAIGCRWLEWHDGQSIYDLFDLLGLDLHSNIRQHFESRAAYYAAPSDQDFRSEVISKAPDPPDNDESGNVNPGEDKPGGSDYSGGRDSSNGGSGTVRGGKDAIEEETGNRAGSVAAVSNDNEGGGDNSGAAGRLQPYTGMPEVIELVSSSDINILDSPRNILYQLQRTWIRGIPQIGCVEAEGGDKENRSREDSPSPEHSTHNSEGHEKGTDTSSPTKDSRRPSVTSMRIISPPGNELPGAEGALTREDALAALQENIANPTFITSDLSSDGSRLVGRIGYENVDGQTVEVVDITGDEDDEMEPNVALNDPIPKVPSPDSDLEIILMDPEPKQARQRDLPTENDTAISIGSRDTTPEKIRAARAAQKSDRALSHTPERIFYFSEGDTTDSDDIGDGIRRPGTKPKDQKEMENPRSSENAREASINLRRSPRLLSEGAETPLETPSRDGVRRAYRWTARRNFPGLENIFVPPHIYSSLVNALTDSSLGSRPQITTSTRGQRTIVWEHTQRARYHSEPLSTPDSWTRERANSFRTAHMRPGRSHHSSSSSSSSDNSSKHSNFGGGDGASDRRPRPRTGNDGRGQHSRQNMHRNATYDICHNESNTQKSRKILNFGGNTEPFTAIVIEGAGGREINNLLADARELDGRGSRKEQSKTTTLPSGSGNSSTQLSLPNQGYPSVIYMLELPDKGEPPKTLSPKASRSKTREVIELWYHLADSARNAINRDPLRPEVAPRSYVRVPSELRTGPEQAAAEDSTEALMADLVVGPQPADTVTVVNVDQERGKANSPEILPSIEEEYVPPENLPGSKRRRSWILRSEDAGQMQDESSQEATQLQPGNKRRRLAPSTQPVPRGRLQPKGVQQLTDADRHDPDSIVEHYAKYNPEQLAGSSDLMLGTPYNSKARHVPYSSSSGGFVGSAARGHPSLSTFRVPYSSSSKSSVGSAAKGHPASGTFRVPYSNSSAGSTPWDRVREPMENPFMDLSEE